MAEPMIHPDQDRLRPAGEAPREVLEEGRLSRGFVDDIIDLLERGNDEAVRALSRK